jgi:hypothetical protein
MIRLNKLAPDFNNNMAHRTSTMCIRYSHCFPNALESISSAVSKQKQYIPILNELIIRVNTETLAGAEEYDETPMIMERVSKSLLPLHYFTITIFK